MDSAQGANRANGAVGQWGRGRGGAYLRRRSEFAGQRYAFVNTRVGGELVNSFPCLAIKQEDHDMRWGVTAYRHSRVFNPGDTR